jgi:hypothetical protein
MASAEQDQWQEICAAARAHLAKRAGKLPDMGHEELAAFVKAVDDVMWAEIKAAVYDETVRDRRREMNKSAIFSDEE